MHIADWTAADAAKLKSAAENSRRDYNAWHSIAQMFADCTPEACRGKWERMVANDRRAGAGRVPSPDETYKRE